MKKMIIVLTLIFIAGCLGPTGNEGTVQRSESAQQVQAIELSEKTCPQEIFGEALVEAKPGFKGSINCKYEYTSVGVTDYGDEKTAEEWELYEKGEGDMPGDNPNANLYGRKRLRCVESTSGGGCISVFRKGSAVVITSTNAETCDECERNLGYIQSQLRSIEVVRK